MQAAWQLMLPECNAAENATGKAPEINLSAFAC